MCQLLLLSAERVGLAGASAVAAVSAAAAAAAPCTSCDRRLLASVMESCLQEQQMGGQSVKYRGTARSNVHAINCRKAGKESGRPLKYL
jgi:hypothetical protein